MPQWVTDPNTGQLTYVDPATGAPADPFGGPSTGLSPEALLALASPQPPPSPTEIAAPDAADLASQRFAEPSTPQPAAPVAAPTPVPGQRASVSTSGFDLPTQQTVLRTTKGRGGLEGQIQAERDRALGQARVHEQQLGAAAEMHRGARTDQTVAETSKIAEEGRQAAQLASIQRQFANEEAAAHQEAAAKVSSYKARYESALADFSAAQVDPNQMWSQMSSGVKFGTMIAAFAHDFLGAQGVRMSFGENLRASIDRNIAAQVENIRRKGDVAQGFKSLWDMQRAESASDAETRERMRGFMLVSAKNQMASELARYDSDFARAKGAEAIAAIDEELVKTSVNLQRGAEEQAQRGADQRIKIWQTATEAALRRQTIQAELAKARLAAAGNAPKWSELVVRDNAGNVIGIADTKEQKLALTDRINATNSMQNKLVELQELQRAEGRVYSGPAATAFLDRNESKLRSLYQDLISDIILAKTGKQANEAERKSLQEILPFDNFTRGIMTGELTGEGTAAAFGVRSIDDLRGSSMAQLRPAPAEIAEAFRGGAGGELFAEPRAKQVPAATGKDRPPPSDAVDTRIGQISGPHPERLVEEVSPQHLEDYAAAGFEPIRETKVSGIKNEPPKTRVTVPLWAAAMSELASSAMAPIEPEDQTKAIVELGRYVGDTGVTELGRQQAAMAQYLLWQIANSSDDNALQAAELLEKSATEQSAQPITEFSQDAFRTSTKRTR